MDKRSHWKFEIADAGWGWTVSHADGSSGASAERWATLKACVDDATLHGYTPWKTEEERRRDPIPPR
jgi:hypothetical protein